MYYRWMDSKYEIVAFVSENYISDHIYGKKIIEPSYLKKTDYDYLVCALEKKEFDKFFMHVEQIDSTLKEKCISIDRLIELDGPNSYLTYTNLRQLGVINELLTASDNELINYEWMYEHVIKYGVFCFNEDSWYKQENDYQWAVYGLQQIPEEFAKFCNMLSSLKVNTAAEVGVYRGRSAFFICAILARKNPDLKYKMIDIVDRIEDYDLFKEVLPQLEKAIPSTSNDYKEESFDFVFIDADHSYDASILDYKNMGVNAKKLVAFHDIYAHEYDHENGGTVRMWQEVMERTKDKEHLVYSIYPDKWMGIGCVKMGE